MNACDVAVQLASRAEEVCRHLFPNGVKKGHEWCVGGISGEAGESLKIHLNSGKSGYWQDFATQQRGKTMLTLWRDSKTPGDMREAVKQAKEFLGITDDHDKYIQRSKPFWRTPAKDGIRGIVPLSPVMKYLTEQRGINESILRLYQVAESKECEGYVFPYFYGETKDVCLLKTVKLERVNGKKQSYTSRESLATLFGKPTVKPDSEYVVITAGEIDAMTWHAAGHPAVSVPMGDNNDKWIEYDWEWLERFERIYLSFDMDASAQGAAIKAVERLGRERCYLVKLPAKDANELWQDGQTELGQYLETAKLIEPPEIQRFFDNEDGIKHQLYGVSEADLGTQLPWLQGIWRVRRRENTIVTGYNGHGKSQWLLHTAVHLQDKGWRGFIGSFEVFVDEAKAQMMQIASGTDRPDATEWERLKQSDLGELVFYAHEGKVEWKKLLEIYRFCVKRYGINFGIFDSFLLCGVDSENYEGQDEFMRQIQITAKDTNTHLFVVCHARKREGSNGEEHPPSKTDVKGSGGLTDLVFNVISVWRNVAKAAQIQQAMENNNTAALANYQVTPDAKVTVLKQKTGKGDERGKLGYASLFFDGLSGQFVRSSGEFPRKFFLPPHPPSYTP